MKIFKVIYYIFIGAIALIAILLIVSAFPITGNYKVLTVLSGSMEPKLKTGSIVVVKPAADYKIGDVITFGPMSKTKAPITHRIYEIKVEGSEPIYITKGDVNDAPDTREISKKEIIGKVLFTVPYLGYAIETAKKPYGFMALIILPAILIISDQAKAIVGEIKKMRAAKPKA